LHWDKGGTQRDEAAAYCRDAIDLAERAPAKERRKVVTTNAAENMISPDDQTMQAAERSMGDLLDETACVVRDNLARMENTDMNSTPRPLPPQDRFRSDGTAMPDTRRRNWVGFGAATAAGQSDSLTPEQVGHMLAVGGSQCDCCGKTRQEIGLTQLNQCSRCHRAYYCSAECQKQQWRKEGGGHKTYCRKPGQIEAGDYVRLHGLQAKPELNGMIVQVVRRAPNNTDRWETRMPGGEKAVSIAQDKMEQLRPLQ